MSSHVDWNLLKTVKLWSPHSELGHQKTELRDGLYRIGENAYAVLGPWAENWQPSEDLRVLSLWWAADDHAASMAVASCASGIARPPNVQPPVELVIGGDARYQALQKSIRRFGGGMESEQGTLDGPSIFRLLSCTQFTYYFRDVQADPTELPFAISITLPPG